MNAREQARNAMKRAWTIRKAAAVECGCKVSEVIFSLCLVQAWREIKMTYISRTWQTSKGATVEVIGELVTSKTVYLDGQAITSETCDVNIQVKLDGMPLGATVTELTPAQKKAYPGFEYKIGSLALTRAQAMTIDEVSQQIKRNPVYVRHINKQAQSIAQNQREIAAYEKSLKECIGGYMDRNTY